MPFLMLLFLTLACLPEPRDRSMPPAWLGVQRSILLTWACVVAVLGVAAVLSRWTSRRLARHAGGREEVLHRYARWRLYHLMGLFALYGLILFGLGWGGVISLFGAYGPAVFGTDWHEVALPDAAAGWWWTFPGLELLILAPFLVGLVFSWALFYDVERALHRAEAPAGEPGRFWGRWAYVSFHIRQNLAVAVPVLLLIALKDLPKLFPQLDDDSWSWADFLMLGAAGGVLAVSPWVFRLVLGLKPLPEGPLRNRLLVAARRLNFRFSNILLWNTRSGVVNALLIGLLPVLRYVVLTDRLIAEMTPDEVEAVFGHEVGHVKHRHLHYFLVFLMVSVGVLAALWGLAEQPLKILIGRQDLAMLVFAVFLGAYIVLVFGFLSRRCERQADIYGCRAVSCTRADCAAHTAVVSLTPGGASLCPTGIRTFIDALEKVASLNGISRDRPGWLQSWQHGTIAWRVEFLQRLIADPGIEPRFQRRVRVLKWLLFLGLGAVLVLLGLNVTRFAEFLDKLWSHLGGVG